MQDLGITNYEDLTRSSAGCERFQDSM